MNEIHKAQVKAMMLFAMKERFGDLSEHYESISDLDDEIETAFEEVLKRYTISNLLSDDFQLSYEPEEDFFYEETEKHFKGFYDLAI